MPLFEYKCTTCNSKFEILHKSSINPDEVSCPQCDSKSTKKLFSSFSPSVLSHSHESNCSSGNCSMPSPGFGCPGGSCNMN